MNKLISPTTTTFCKHLRLFALAVAMFCAPAFAQTSADFSPRQQEILKELYEAFPDAADLQTLRARLGADIKQHAIATVHNDDSLPTFGTVDGAPIVEFSDYQCGYCKRMYPLLRAENTRVKIVEFPVLGKLSVMAARYALAARNQNGYSAYHIALMEHSGRLTEEALEEAAVTANLDFAQLQKDSESEEISAALQKNRKLAAALEVRGTPFLIIGDRAVPGAIDAERLQQMIAQAQ